MRVVMLVLLLCCTVLAAPAFRKERYAEAPTPAKGKMPYSIEVAYPVWTAPLDRANEPARKLVMAEVQTFKSHYKEMDVEDRGPDLKASLDLDFEVRESNPSILTVLYSGSAFLGGAHPNPFYAVQLLSLKDGRTVSLASCFRPNSPWLQTLAQECRRELKRQKTELGPWHAEGTAPKASNYRLAMPEANGIRVMFAPYQIAPYAAGTIEVMVPYQRLRKHIDPRGPLAFALR
jgi:hypothetical protein